MLLLAESGSKREIASAAQMQGAVVYCNYMVNDATQEDQNQD